MSGKNSSEREKFFLSFLACPDPFHMVMKPGWCFLIFLKFFFYFFANSQARVGKKRFRSWKICSLFFCLSRPVSAWNKAKMMFFIFWIFFLFFWEFSSSGWVKTFPNEKNFFSLFRPLPTQLGLKWSQDDFFKFFCYYFWNSVDRCG